jgi:hypothetical protein
MEWSLKMLKGYSICFYNRDKDNSQKQVFLIIIST